MSDASERWTADADEGATVRLLRLAGARPAVPAERAARVRAAVHGSWRAATRRRLVLRRVAYGTLPAAAAALFLVVEPFTSTPSGPAPGELVAVVEQVDGTPHRTFTIQGDESRARLARQDHVRTGEWIETDAGGRVALRFSDGASVRLDVGSRARPVSSNAIELSSGAAYIDTGRESGRFEVRTAMGVARDIGTQFEVRLLDRMLRLRVRTGVVELHDGDRSVSGRGGTEIMFTADNAVSRPLATHGSEWGWTTRVSPPLHIEGMVLSVFLERMAREHGWRVLYADPALEREASGIVLHGSIERLQPREAMEVTIATSGLRHRLEAGELAVFRGSQ